MNRPQTMMPTHRPREISANHLAPAGRPGVSHAASWRRTAREADRQRQHTNDHEHLPPERRCHELTHRFSDDLNKAGQEQHGECPVHPRHQGIDKLRHAAAGSAEPEKPQADHDRAAEHHRYAEDVDGLRGGDHPRLVLKPAAQRGTGYPICPMMRHAQHVIPRFETPYANSAVWYRQKIYTSRIKIYLFYCLRISSCFYFI